MYDTPVEERERKNEYAEERPLTASELAQKKIHDEQRSNAYRRLVSGEERTASAERTYSSELFPSQGSAYSSAPAYDSVSTARSPEPGVGYTVPSAKQRIHDYVPVTVGMKTIQKFGETPAYQTPRVTDYAPVAPAPAEEPVRTRGALFEGITFRDGTVYAPAPAPAPEAEPLRVPEYDPSYSEEDALPTKQTMNTLLNGEKEEGKGFFAALSTRTKVVLAAVATVIIVMIALVCINTAILNSMNANIANSKQELTRLAERQAGVEREIGEITDPDNIDSWAQQQGMTRAEG